MAVFFFVAAAVCALGAIQERRDFMRCFGFLLFAGLLALVGMATR